MHGCALRDSGPKRSRERTRSAKKNATTQRTDHALSMSWTSDITSHASREPSLWQPIVSPSRGYFWGSFRVSEGRINAFQCVAAGTVNIDELLIQLENRASRRGQHVGPGTFSCSWFESRYPSTEIVEFPRKSDSILPLASGPIRPAVTRLVTKNPAERASWAFSRTRYAPAPTVLQKRPKRSQRRTYCREAKQNDDSSVVADLVRMVTRSTRPAFWSVSSIPAGSSSTASTAAS